MPEGHLRPKPGAFTGCVGGEKIAVAGNMCAGCVQLCVLCVPGGPRQVHVAACAWGVRAGVACGPVLGSGCVLQLQKCVRVCAVCWVPGSGRGEFRFVRCKQGMLKVVVKSVQQY